MPAVTKTHTLEVPVNHSLVVNVDQALRDVPQLGSRAIVNKPKVKITKKPTGPSRSASGCAFTKSLIFPLAIQFDTIANWLSDIITPTRGRTFGCRRVLHITTSLQNLYIYTACVSEQARGKRA